MPRQLVLPLDYGMLIKETALVRLLDVQLYTRYINESIFTVKGSYWKT